MTDDGKGTGAEVTETATQELGETNLKMSQLQQEAADEYWESILESIQDGFWVLDREWCCTYINNRQAQLIGMPKADVLGKNVWELFPDLVGTEVYNQLHRAVAEETPVHFEHFSPTWQGWFEIRVNPSAKGVSILTIEITERQAKLRDRNQTEEALRASEQHLKIALQTAKLGSWQHDILTDTLTCSEQCKANFGLPPDAEFSHQTLFAALHPDDRDRVQAAIQQAVEEQTDYEVEERCFWPDGSLHWLIARGRLIYDAEGTPVRMVGVTLDITERKQFEEALKAANQQISNVIASITDAFVTFDHQWRYTYVNQEAARLLQRKPEELLGKRWQDVFPQATQSRTFVAQELERAVAEQVTVQFEVFSVEVNRWLEISAFPFPDGLTVYFRDISKRKQEEQRKAARYAVTRVLAEATTFAETVPAILQSLCESLGWQVGMIWSVDRHNNVLRYVNSWQASSVNVHEFIEANQQTTFALGVGLPGRIWESREAIWIPELNQATNLPRATSAGREGLHTVFGFPIQLGDEILGVIECFSNQVQQPDEDLLQMMAVIGSQIGQFMERKRTEGALRESQELFRTFMNHSPIAAFIKDDAGRYIYVKPIVKQLLKKHTPADLVGKTDFDFLPVEVAEQLRANDAAVLSGGKAIQVPETLQLEDGKHHYMTFKFPFQDASGRQLLAGVAIDVTEQIRVQDALQESEEKYRRIVETANEGIWVFDAEARTTYVNPRMAQILGYSPEEILGRSVIDFTFEEHQAQAQQRLELHKQGVGEWMDALLRHKDGSPVWIRSSTSRIVDDNGQYVGLLAMVTDVSDAYRQATQRKRAEEALRQREQRFSTLFNGMDDWVLVYHLTPAGQPGRFIEVNEPACKKLGYSREELLTMSVADILGSPAINPKANAEKLLDEKHLVVESVHTTKDGRLIPVEVSATLFTLNGLPTVQSICRDITERKQAEEALRKSEGLYRAIGETIDYGIWVCEPDGRNVYVSQSFLRLVGLTQEQCSEFGWGDVLHPDDAKRTIAAWKECVQTGGIWDIEHCFRGVDGNWHPILARGVPVRDETGEIVCWAGINLDISRLKRVEAELRESEERFRLATRAVAGVVYDWDVQTDRVYRSEGLYRLIGVYPEDAPQTRDWWIERVHPDDLAHLESLGDSILTGSEAQYEAEYRVRHQDGRWIDVRDCSYLIRDGNGQIIRVLGSSIDITDRKRAETEREQLLARERAAREEAEAANRIKDEFLAVLSHELRSPLNPILGWTSLLRTRKFDEQAMDRALEIIERNAKLQTQLIEDLLDVSRILQGKMALNVYPVNLVSTIEAAIETVRLAAQAKGIQIQTQLDAAVPPISGDSGRLQQVVWNLLSNAVKFTPAGGRVEVRLQELKVEGSDELNVERLKVEGWEDNLQPATPQQPATSYVQIQVKDTGKGISPEFLPHVFEYFRQADSTITRTFGGLGLGLAIVRHLVELHGGTVEAESLGEGQGATFTVLLPGMVTVSQTSLNNQPSTSPVDLKGLRVLVVDDEADMRDLVDFILSEYGAKVRVATSATEALLVLEQFKPDVLVSDIGMPGEDGYALMRQIRTRPSHKSGQIPAIALTAYAGEFNQQQALAAGFQMHISKPVEPAELVKAILTLVIHP